MPLFNYITNLIIRQHIYKSVHAVVWRTEESDTSRDMTYRSKYNSSVHVITINLQ